MIVNLQQNKELKMKFEKETKGQGELVYKHINLDHFKDLELKKLLNYLKEEGI
jgi:hypothetical protein